jgi:hypothetical protein
MKQDGVGGNAALIGKDRNAYGDLVGKPEGKSYFEDLGIDGRILSGS